MITARDILCRSCFLMTRGEHPHQSTIFFRASHRQPCFLFQFVIFRLLPMMLSQNWEFAANWNRFLVSGSMRKLPCDSNSPAGEGLSCKDRVIGPDRSHSKSNIRQTSCEGSASLSRHLFEHSSGTAPVFRLATYDSRTQQNSDRILAWWWIEPCCSHEMRGMFYRDVYKMKFVERNNGEVGWIDAKSKAWYGSLSSKIWPNNIVSASCQGRLDSLLRKRIERTAVIGPPAPALKGRENHFRTDWPDSPRWQIRALIGTVGSLLNTNCSRQGALKYLDTSWVGKHRPKLCWIHREWHKH